MLPLDGYARCDDRATTQRIVRSQVARCGFFESDHRCPAVHLLREDGTCKTEASRKPVPLDERVAADLWLWKESSKYQDPSDWIFASPRVDGKQPFWPDIVLQKIIRPAAVRAGIRKRIGWHTFRHTYSTLLIGNGENVKVVQELMRHASTRFTIEVYTQARIEAKRQAQQRLVQTILSEENDGLAPVIHGRSDVVGA